MIPPESIGVSRRPAAGFDLPPPLHLSSYAPSTSNHRFCGPRQSIPSPPRLARGSPVPNSITYSRTYPHLALKPPPVRHCGAGPPNGSATARLLCPPRRLFLPSFVLGYFTYPCRVHARGWTHPRPQPETKRGVASPCNAVMQTLVRWASWLRSHLHPSTHHPTPPLNPNTPSSSSHVYTQAGAAHDERQISRRRRHPVPGGWQPRLPLPRRADVRGVIGTIGLGGCRSPAPGSSMVRPDPCPGTRAGREATARLARPMATRSRSHPSHPPIDLPTIPPHPSLAAAHDGDDGPLLHVPVRHRRRGG